MLTACYRDGECPAPAAPASPRWADSRPLCLPSAALPRDLAKPALFKLDGPTVRADPVTKIQTIEEDDIKIISVSADVFWVPVTLPL